MTGLVSIFFPDTALMIYRRIYGIHPIELKQLKLTFRPWGNLALTVGLIGFVSLQDMVLYKEIIIMFSVLLLIRIGYRTYFQKKLKALFKITYSQNICMIIIQLIGVALFTLFYITHI